MTNLLEETLHILGYNHKSEKDVIWVGDSNFKTTWENFEKIAENFDYDDGFGGAEVYRDLKIVGKDWWLERGEYDGSEWWDFKTLPKEPITINEMIGCKEGSWFKNDVWKSGMITPEI